MSFFIKKNVTECLGHHYAIWTSDSNFLLAQKFYFGSFLENKIFFLSTDPNILEHVSRNTGIFFLGLINLC